MSRIHRRGWRYAIAGAVALSLTLSACTTGSSSPSQTLPAGEEANLGVPGPELCNGRDYVIGYNSFSDSEAFAVNVRKSIEAAAEATGCIELKALIDNADPATVVQNAQSFVQQEVDGVISFNVLDGPNGAIINMYDQADIPVVAIALYAVGVTFVSTNDRESGLAAGRAGAEAFAEQFPGETPVVVIGEAPQAGLVNINRAGGVEDGVKETFPDAHVVRVDGQGAQEPSSTAGASALQGIDPDAKLIVSGINENTVYGLYTALQRTNRVENSVVIGVGGDEVGFNGVCHLPGYVADVAYFPERYGEQAIPAILARINDEPVPPAVYVPFEVLTKETLPEAYPDYDC